MYSYPILIHPPKISKLQETVPVLEIFKQPAPPKSKDEQPTRFDFVTLIPIALATIAGAILFSKFGLFIIAIGCFSFSGVAFWNYSTYPKRFGKFEKVQQVYQGKLNKYLKAKELHEREQALLSSAEGIAKYRKDKILELLAKTPTTDGFHVNENQGSSEQMFKEHLIHFFCNRIFIDQRVNNAKNFLPFVPDFIYIDTNINVHIDIEIDEPYSFIGREPVHYQDKDLERNQFFSDRGWLVLRFSEEQVVRYPDSCCKFLAHVVSKFVEEIDLSAFDSVPDLASQPQWTLGEAREMLLRDYRKTYLHLLPKWIRQKPVFEPELPSESFTPSEYQQKIFDFILNGTGDGIVIAVAGSGKTKTLVEASKLVAGKNAIFLAFNKSIASELSERLHGKMKAKTLNSLGFDIVQKALGKCRIVSDKYRKLANEFGKGETLARLVDLCRHTLISSENLEEVLQLGAIYGFNAIEVKEVFPLIKDVLAAGIEMAQTKKVIDYTDQIWLPIVLNLQLKQPYQWIFCDEAQDFSPCQLEMVLGCKAAEGRILFVGDPQQAIYGFAGADSQSIEKIAKRTEATSLPLSICYRCPTSHLDLARAIVPHIEARPDAIEGVINEIDLDSLHKYVQSGDLIVCRLNAPLIKACLSLIVKGINARLSNNELIEDLENMVYDVEKQKNFSLEQFGKHLKNYQHERESRLDPKKEMSKIYNLRDKLDMISLVYERYEQLEGIEDLCTSLRGIFTKDSHDFVRLSTIHGAKGLEANRVFILHPDKLPLERAGQQDWEDQQEQHLHYVALTRAKQELWLVKGK